MCMCTADNGDGAVVNALQLPQIVEATVARVIMYCLILINDLWPVEPTGGDMLVKASVPGE